MAETYIKPTNPKFKDLTGRKFGRWTAIRFRGRSKHKQCLWLVRCECGVKKIVRGAALKSGQSKSHGCLQREIVSKQFVTHGLSRHPAFGRYRGIERRCYDPKFTDYKNYGGRGIYVCVEWREHPEIFCAWVETQFPPDGKIPSGMQIERRDNDGPYSPDNCYFTTRSQQNRNKRTNRLLAFNGRTITVAQWAEELDIPVGILRGRLHLGWSIERVLTTPISHSHSHPRGGVSCV